MNNQQIKDLEKQLWDSADNLRANSKLTAAEYKDPVLGLILLRFAQNRFEEAKVQIENNLPVNPRTGQKRDISLDLFVFEFFIFSSDNFLKFFFLIILSSIKRIFFSLFDSICY